jgi:hypothetical protein
VDVGPLLEFLGGKQNAGKQRICEVSQLGMQNVAELENETWRMKHGAPKEGTSVLQQAVAANRK